MTARAGAALDAFLGATRQRLEDELARVLADQPGDAGDPGRLREAMRYAVLGAGKRLRPAVVLAAARAAARGPEAAADERAMPAAIAIELLHAYTLVHDDLPAMDDDDLRRGKPTVHVAFGEATAILVGDALLTEAFARLAALGPDAGEAMRVLARRAGTRGLLHGQARDLSATGAAPSIEGLERIHAGKTGALFAAAAELGGVATEAGTIERARLADYGLALGIAFQHADDLEDGDHPHLAQEARRRLAELAAQARASLEVFGERASLLAALVDRVAKIS